MRQDIVNLDRRLITTGLYLSDRLLHIWERVKCRTDGVSQEVQGITPNPEANGQSDLPRLAQELELFLVKAKALGLNIGEELKEWPPFEQAAVPASHSSLPKPTLASNVIGHSAIPPT